MRCGRSEYASRRPASPGPGVRAESGTRPAEGSGTGTPRRETASGERPCAGTDSEEREEPGGRDDADAGDGEDSGGHTDSDERDNSGIVGPDASVGGRTDSDERDNSGIVGPDASDGEDSGERDDSDARDNSGVTVTGADAGGGFGGPEGSGGWAHPAVVPVGRGDGADTVISGP
ncbi:hypothetical protein [Streptomyces sp. NPDC096013]|uniref:hypothetical protein n=1 Tax=Streptomyces sp. NPDC096013 TaxID=3366069 RepID=UPI00381AF9FB